MVSTPRTVLWPYVGTAILTAAAVLVRWLLDPWLGDSLPFATLYGTVALAVWLGGWRPAVLAAVLGVFACQVLFVAPRGSLGLDQARPLVGTLTCLASCGLIIGLGEAMQAARRRADQLREIATQETGQQREAREEVQRLNRELKRRADELQTILDMLPIGVAIAHDPLCRRIIHNPYMSELLNVPAWANASLTAPQPERPTNFTNYRDGKEVPTSELPMQLACTGAEVRDLELDLVCQGREPRRMLCYARPLFDEQGRVRGSVGACLDITARKRAEEALRGAKERLEIVTDSMAVAVARCGRDLRFQWVSKAFAEMLGRAPAEIVGRLISEVVGTEAVEQLRPHLEQVLAGRVVRSEEEVGYVAAGRRWIRAVYTPTLGQDGVPDGWVGVFLDVSERRRMEDALRERETQLAAELEATTRLHALSTRLLSADDLTSALEDVLENAIVTAGADFGNIQLYNGQAEALEIVAQRGFGREFLDHFRTVRVDGGSACGQAMRQGERIIIEDVERDPAFEPHRPVARAAGYRAV